MGELQCETENFTGRIIFMSMFNDIEWREKATLQKTNCDFTSISGLVIKKNSSRGPKNGHSERQIMFFMAKQMLEKARQGKHGSHPTILSKVVRPRRIPKVIGGAQCWRKGSDAFRSHRSWKTRLYSYESWTVAERQTLDSSFECWWAQKPLRQRPEFAVASQNNALKCKMLTWRKQQRQRQDQQFEGGENFDYHVDRKTGWRYYREPRWNSSAASSSSTSQWQKLTMANELELMVFHIIW